LQKWQLFATEHRVPAKRRKPFEKHTFELSIKSASHYVLPRRWANAETATQHYSPVGVEPAPRDPDHAAVLADLDPETTGAAGSSPPGDARWNAERQPAECAGPRQICSPSVRGGLREGACRLGLLLWLMARRVRGPGGNRCTGTDGLPRSSSPWRSPGAPPWPDQDRHRTRPISKAILATPTGCTSGIAGQRAPAPTLGRRSDWR
jgi:hypothetical protein